MSHRKDSLTWYQLFLRISKMRLGVAKKDTVMIKIDGELKPICLEYDNSGTIPYLAISGAEKKYDDRR